MNVLIRLAFVYTQLEACDFTIKYIEYYIVLILANKSIYQT